MRAYKAPRLTVTHCVCLCVWVRSGGPALAMVAAADPSRSAALDASVNGLVQTLHRVQVDLAEQQADVNSPLYSAKTFEELSLYASALS